MPPNPVPDIVFIKLLEIKFKFYVVNLMKIVPPFPCKALVSVKVQYDILTLVIYSKFIDPPLDLKALLLINLHFIIDKLTL